MLWGYTAFVAALLLTIFSKSDFSHARLVGSLLAVSLPSLVALPLLDYIVRVAQERKTSATRGLAYALGFFPSLLAMAIVIGHLSIIAAIAFVLLIVFWALMLFGVAFVKDRESTV